MFDIADEGKVQYSLQGYLAKRIFFSFGLDTSRIIYGFERGQFGLKIVPPCKKM